MRVVNKTVDMIASFSREGLLAPKRFKFGDEDAAVIKVDRLIDVRSEKVDKKVFLYYTCSSVVDDCERRFELKFEAETLRWTLYRM